MSLSANAVFQLALYLVVLIGLAKPLGRYMARVYEGRASWLGPLESVIYRMAGVRPGDHQ